MEEYVSLRDFAEFWRRHRPRIFIALAATIGLVMGATVMLTPIYEAESLLLVKYGREYMYRPELGERDAIAVALNKDRQLAQINSELAILRSRELFADVLGQVGIGRLYPSLEAAPGGTANEAALERLEASVTAYQIKDSDVIRVKLEHPDRELAAQALNTIVDKYMARHLNAFSDASTTAFLEQKVAASRKELQQAEEKLKAFQMRTRSFSGDQPTAQLAQRDELESKRKAARSQIAGLEKRLTYLNSEKEKVASDTSRISSEESKAVADARAQLLELQLQEQKLMATFSEGSRAVQNVRGQIKLVEDFLAQQRATVGQGAFVDDLDKQIISTQAELRFQQAQADTLAGQIAALEREIGDFTQSGAEYRELVRDREAAAKSHETYTKKLEEFRASEEMDRQKLTNISVIQAAVAPLAPIRPNKKLNLLISVMLGLALGFGWGLLVELRERQSQGDAAVVPTDQETLVAPGTIHWRKVLRQAAEARPDSDRVAETPPPSASKGRGA
jgi:uncharacterized protein involved in exopolysaccharide biosynthesis